MEQYLSCGQWVIQEGSGFDEFLDNGLFMAELSPLPEPPKNPDEVQNHQLSTNEQDEFWNSIFITTDEVEDYPEIFTCKQPNLITTNQSFNFSMNDPCPIQSLSKKGQESNMRAKQC